MSLKLNSSGGGSVTIQEPTTASNFTLTLPASTGTVLTTSGISAPVEFPAGSASLPSITASGDTNTGMFFPAADTIAFATAGTEDFRIGSAGQLGIGGANYGTSGQVLTSAGSGAAPTWSTPASASGTVTSIATGTGLTGGTITTSGTISLVTTVGAVGTYALMNVATSTNLNPGNTIAGSNLRYTNLRNYNFGTPSGTWQAMGGTTDTCSSGDYTTVFIRVA